MTQTTNGLPTTTAAPPGSFADAEHLARDFVCGDCGAEMVVLKIVGEPWRARCGKQPSEHETIVLRTERQKDEVRQRLERDPRVAQALAIQGARAPLTSQAIAELDNAKLLARVPDRYGTTIEVSPQQRVMLAQIARLYQLDPLWDLMLYEGRPYVTYEGRLRKLREAAGYQGHRVRPLNREEKEAWGFDPQDLVVQCDVEMGSHGVVTDWGVVRAEEITAAIEKQRRNNASKPAPVASHPQQFALKRAIARASRQAVGIDLPTWGAGEVVDVEPVREAPPDRPRLVDDTEARQRARFWAIAKGEPPEGLGIDERQVHELLGVETLTGYRGGWDQALSDLTEAASNREPPAAAAPETTAGTRGAGLLSPTEPGARTEGAPPAASPPPIHVTEPAPSLEEPPADDDMGLPSDPEEADQENQRSVAERVADGEVVSREDLWVWARDLERQATSVGLQPAVARADSTAAYLVEWCQAVELRVNRQLDKRLAAEQELQP